MSRFAEAPVNNQNKDVLALLTMLSNPDELKVKLAELTQREKELDEKISLVADANQIVIMRKNCEIMQAEALTELENAKIKAKELVDKASADAEALVARARQEAADLMEVYENHRITQEEILKEKYSALEESKRIDNRNALVRQEEFKIRSKDLDDLELRLHNTQQELNDRQKQLEIRETKLATNTAENESLLNELMEWQTDLQTLCASWQNDMNNIARER